MDDQKRTLMLKETFDTVSDGYDGASLRFFTKSAEHLAAFLELRGEENVLDVACGTGHAALSVANRLSNGKVTAVDFSPGMLTQARKKAAFLAVRNVEFVEGDMQNLGFENRFDIAVCAFGIFFVMDMEAQLAHIASAVKPGGRIAITNFLENYFSPCKELLFERLSSYGVENPPQAWKRIAHQTGCKQLFEAAGLSNVRVETINEGYYLDSADDWWSIVWNAGFRRYVTQLSRQEQERFKQEHLSEIEALRKTEGIWLDVGVLYTIGTKPKKN